MATARRMRTAAAAAQRPATSVQGTRSTTARLGTRTETYSETHDEEVLSEDRFPEGVEPALVRFSAGLTINLENYESLRLDASVTLPSLPSQIAETFERAAEFVGEKLAEQQTLWLNQR